MFTKQITEPIRRLTELTEKLKQATDVEAKKVVINTVQQDPIFHSIRQRFENDQKKT